MFGPKVADHGYHALSPFDPALLKAVGEDLLNTQPRSALSFEVDARPFKENWRSVQAANPTLGIRDGLLETCLFHDGANQTSAN